MRGPWFKSFSLIYYPCSITGCIITIFFVAIFIHDFIFIDSRSHSISDLYYNFLPYGGMYIIFYLWIASKKASKQRII